MDWQGVVEAGRGIMSAARLGRAPDGADALEDPKFALGDLISGTEVAKEEFQLLAAEIGYDLTPSNLRSYRQVAIAWPPESRVSASWTAHRTLATLPHRHDLIRPGMTLRDAQKAAGKIPSDHRHPSKWPWDDRIEYLVTQLQDPVTAKAVRDHVEGRKHARSARAAARAVEEERSAEYREALRELREARDAKTPERATYEALFKLRDAREYVRAIAKATDDEHSFLPAERLSEIVVAVHQLADGAVETLGALSTKEPAAVSKAVNSIIDCLEPLLKPATLATIKGEVFNPEPELSRPTQAAGVVISGELA
jgi:hypothetical protein